MRRTRPGPAAPWQDWVDSLAAWRDQFRVPASVYLGEGDRRIRLDLDEPSHLWVLRMELERKGHATVREAPDVGAFGWIDGRAHDIVIPLAATGQPVPRWAWAGRTLSREHGHLPGSGDWLYAKLYGHPGRQLLGGGYAVAPGVDAWSAGTHVVGATERAPGRVSGAGA